MSTGMTRSIFGRNKLKASCRLRCRDVEIEGGILRPVALSLVDEDKYRPVLEDMENTRGALPNSTFPCHVCTPENTPCLTRASSPLPRSCASACTQCAAAPQAGSCSSSSPRRGQGSLEKSHARPLSGLLRALPWSRASAESILKNTLMANRRAGSNPGVLLDPHPPRYPLSPAAAFGVRNASIFPSVCPRCVGHTKHRW